MENIKKNLSEIVPKELFLNIDYLAQIKENGFLYVPMSFIRFISAKYDIEMDILNTLEYRQFILGLVPNNQMINNQIKTLPFVTKKDKIRKIKDRRRLLIETPLAQFSY